MDLCQKRKASAANAMPPGPAPMMIRSCMIIFKKFDDCSNSSETLGLKKVSGWGSNRVAHRPSMQPENGRTLGRTRVLVKDLKHRYKNRKHLN